MYGEAPAGAARATEDVGREAHRRGARYGSVGEPTRPRSARHVEHAGKGSLCPARISKGLNGSYRLLGANAELGEPSPCWATPHNIPRSPGALLRACATVYLLLGHCGGTLCAFMKPRRGRPPHLDPPKLLATTLPLSVYELIGELAVALRRTKGQVVTEAIHAYAAKNAHFLPRRKSSTARR
jgi:hypothetical protein